MSMNPMEKEYDDTICANCDARLLQPFVPFSPAFYGYCSDKCKDEYVGILVEMFSEAIEKAE